MIAHRQQYGMAILSVMWVLVLLAMLAAMGSGRARSQLQQAHADVLTTQRKYDEQSAVVIAIATGCDGISRSLHLSHSELRVRCSADSARLSINHADRAQWQRFLMAVGESGQVAQGLADHILDWRDADNIRRVQGAELQDYLHAGRTVFPSNKLFASVSELRNVLGIDSVLYRKISPYLTVLNDKGGVYLPHVSAPVFSSIEGSEHYDVQRFLLSKTSDAAVLQRSYPLLNDRQLMNGPTRRWRVVVQSMLQDQAVGMLDTVVDMTDGDARILHWYQGVENRL